MSFSLTFPEGAALVTGGTGRVGGAVTRKLAAAGMPVVFTYRTSKDAARDLEEQLRHDGHQVTAVQMDMTDMDSVTDALAQVEALYGPMKVVICGAGEMVKFGKLADFPVDTIRDFLNGDALGYYRVFHAAMPILRANGGGCLIPCSTMATQRVIEFDGMSPFSKGAVDALVRQVAAEEWEHGIRCNAVAIGWVEHRTVAEVEEQSAHLGATAETEEDRMFVMLRQIAGLARRDRAVTPDEAANTFLYLASNEGAHLTGQTIALDAGVLL